MKLRDALLDALKSLPGERQFHIHVLVSAPRKHADLFPYAVPRPRVELQDILVLCSEGAERVFVAGIEAALYHVPATLSAVLNVCKVDSTGQGPAPPPTRALVSAFVHYFTDPATTPLPVRNVWVHLCARAQNQYLFPNSSEHKGKRVLTDIKLCAWWRRLVGEVATQTLARAGEGDKPEIVLSYVVAGLNELEAVQALGSSPPQSPQWSYGHPYTQSRIPLPCPPPPKDRPHNLAHYIPCFDDDPKHRFMDEIACTHERDEVRSPKAKRRKTKHGGARADSSDEEEERPPGETGKVSPDEFWERMSFRQECVAGAVTGFFVFAVSFPASTPNSAAEHRRGHVSPQLNRRVLASLLTGVEFSTVDSAVRGTATIEASIKSLCEGLTPDSRPPPSKIKPVSRVGGKPRSRAAKAPAQTSSEEQPVALDHSAEEHPSEPHTPPRTTMPLPCTPPRTTMPLPRTPPRTTMPLPRTPPRTTMPLPRTPPLTTMLLPPSPHTPPRGPAAENLPALPPAPGSVEGSLETYNEFVYGTIQVSNAPLAPRAGKAAAPASAPVTVLTARKKKRPAA